MISVGVLYDAQKLLEYVTENRTTAATLLASFDKFEVADFPTVLAISQKYQWLVVTETDYLAVSHLGKSICDAPTPESKLRYQLHHVLAQSNESWTKKIADGRSEARRFLPADVQQIFKEAGLLEAWTDDLRTWWDSISLEVRFSRNKGLFEIGRKAEWLSMQYEHERTKQAPEWKCLETNYAGYDILSVLSSGSSVLQPIEVKGSTLRLKEATFVLTKNEWQTATDNENYTLHLWLLQDPPDPAKHLRVVPATKLEEHIPKEGGKGKWETVRIPFSIFWSASH